MTIDKRAEIHPKAEIGSNVTIGPWTYIEEGVVIGDNTWVAPHVVIRKGTTIGKGNQIHQFASIGDEPQHRNSKGFNTRVEIGDSNVIREYVSIGRGTESSSGVTHLGDKNYLMAYSHVGHDSWLGNEVMMVNNATLAGHVIVKDYAMIGAFCAVHQFVTIGEYCFIAQSCLVGQNTIPYTLVAGHTAMARVYGLNLVGLRRRGITKEAIRTLQQAYKIIFDITIKRTEIIPQLEKLLPGCPEVGLMINAIEEALKGRGFLRKSGDAKDLEEGA